MTFRDPALLKAALEIVIPALEHEANKAERTLQGGRERHPNHVRWLNELVRGYRSAARHAMLLKAHLEKGK